MKLYNIRVNTHLCDGCGNCYTACPVNASLNKKGRLDETTAIILIHDGKATQGIDGCDGCGVCVEICHKDAIKLEQKD